MINVESIITAEISSVPWEHLVVENILNQEIFEMLSSELLKVSPHLKNIQRNKNGWWPFELIKMGITQDVIDVIMKINKQILDNSNLILSKFKNPNRSSIGYYSVPRFAYTPANERGQIHDDGEAQDKSMVMVIYLYPPVSHGTCLYSEKNLDTFIKELPWKPNSATIFAPREGVTWHDFKADIKERLTMNFYYEKLEHSHHINHFGEEKVTWFYEEMTKNNLIVEFKND
jgi:hypothetical protein